MHLLRLTEKACTQVVGKSQFLKSVPSPHLILIIAFSAQGMLCVRIPSQPAAEEWGTAQKPDLAHNYTVHSASYTHKIRGKGH